MTYTVFYATAAAFRDMGFGVDFAVEQALKFPGEGINVLDLTDLTATHRPVAVVQGDPEGSDLVNAEAIFALMQGETWSPNGEARQLILDAGLTHTSMSVGDVIVTEIGQVFSVANCGFLYHGVRGATHPIYLEAV